MKLATDMGITVKKTALKAKVRAFLDQKACCPLLPNCGFGFVT